MVLLSICSKQALLILGSYSYFWRFRKALLSSRTDKRKKTVIVHAQPEALIGIGRVVTPVSTMLEHVLMSRLNDMSEGRLHAYSIC